MSTTRRKLVAVCSKNGESSACASSMRATAHILGNETALREDDADLRVVGSEAHVAGHGEAESDTDAATVDRADNWLA